MSDVHDKPAHTTPTAPTDKKSAIEADTHTASTVTSIDQKPTPGFLRVKVYTPFKVFYEGDALSVSAKNQTGDFDVLPGHKNFITMLVACDVKVQTPKKEIKATPIARALMHIKEDKLIIFVDV